MNLFDPVSTVPTAGSARPMPNFRPVSRQATPVPKEHTQTAKSSLDAIPLSQLICSHLGRSGHADEPRGDNEDDDQLAGDSNFDNAGVGSEFVNIFKAFDDEDMIDEGFTQTNQFQKAEFNEKPARRFGTKEKAVTPKWEEEETQLFFRVLSMCGTDFSMISKFFPNRTRKMIANKFHCEQAKNRERVAECISERRPLDLNLYASIVGIDESSIIDDYQRNKGRLADADNLFGSQRRAPGRRGRKNEDEEEKEDDEEWVDADEDENQNQENDPENDEIEGDLNF